MPDSFVPEGHSAPFLSDLRSLQLYRWWDSSIVGLIDHEQVVDRTVLGSGWSPRYAFTILVSAAIAGLGLPLSSPALAIGALVMSSPLRLFRLR